MSETRDRDRNRKGGFTDRERELLTEVEPPTGHEARAMDKLRQAGLVVPGAESEAFARQRLAPVSPASRQRFGWRIAIAASVATLLLSFGFAAGRATSRAAAGEAEAVEPNYLLLLYRDAHATTQPPEARGADARAAAADAHARWAAEQRRRGFGVTGGPIRSQGYALAPVDEGPRSDDEPGDLDAARSAAEPLPSDAELVGYFLVRVDTPAEALELAQSSPHLTHGGHVAVRELGHDDGLDILRRSP